MKLSDDAAALLAARFGRRGRGLPVLPPCCRSEAGAAPIIPKPEQHQRSCKALTVDEVMGIVRTGYRKYLRNFRPRAPLRHWYPSPIHLESHATRQSFSSAGGAGRRHGRTRAPRRRAGEQPPGHGRATRHGWCRSRGDDNRLRQGPYADERHPHDSKQRHEPHLHPQPARQLRPKPPLPADVRAALAERHRQRRRHGRIRRSRLGLLRTKTAVEQQYDLRRAAGYRQRVGQHRRPRPDPHRRPDAAGRRRPLRRHDAAVRSWAGATAVP